MSAKCDAKITKKDPWNVGAFSLDQTMAVMQMLTGPDKRQALVVESVGSMSNVGFAQTYVVCLNCSIDHFGLILLKKSLLSARLFKVSI